MGFSALCQTPTWRTRVSLFVSDITLDLSGMGSPTSSICYRQHSSQDHVTTQAPPLRQSRDTFRGLCKNLVCKNLVFHFTTDQCCPHTMHSTTIIHISERKAELPHVLSTGVHWDSSLTQVRHTIGWAVPNILKDPWTFSFRVKQCENNGGHTSENTSSHSKRLESSAAEL